MGMQLRYQREIFFVFCDCNASNGIEKMRGIIEKVWEDGDHLLIDKILVRSEGKWSYSE